MPLSAQHASDKPITYYSTTIKDPSINHLPGLFAPDFNRAFLLVERSPHVPMRSMAMAVLRLIGLCSPIFFSFFFFLHGCMISHHQPSKTKNKGSVFSLIASLVTSYPRYIGRYLLVLSHDLRQGRFDSWRGSHELVYIKVVSLFFLLLLSYYHIIL